MQSALNAKYAHPSLSYLVILIYQAMTGNEEYSLFSCPTTRLRYELRHGRPSLVVQSQARIESPPLPG